MLLLFGMSSHVPTQHGGDVESLSGPVTDAAQIAPCAPMRERNFDFDDVESGLGCCQRHRDFHPEVGRERQDGREGRSAQGTLSGERLLHDAAREMP